MPDKQMTIRELSEEFGITARTLRFYESKELIFPLRVGQKRLYSRRDRARLKLILIGKRFGASLEEIRQLLDLYSRDDSNETQLRSGYALAQVKLREMIEQREELTNTIEDLREQMQWAEERLAEIERPVKTPA